MILNYIEHEMSLYQAISAIRYHHQWSPDEIRVDGPGFSSDAIRKLEKLGHSVRIRDLGCKIQAISFENGQLHGVSDPRGQGLSIGE